ADNTLRIHKTGVANSGVFTCKAKNAAGETTFDTIIRISTPPIIAPTQTSFNHIPGDSLILPCEVEGEPRPDIQWYLNGRPAPGTVDHSGSLVIDNINERHTGEYTCVATNFVGKDEITMTVTVHTPPVIDGSDLPKSLVVNVNETIEFPCPARAYPPPQRVWTYEDSRVEFDPQFAGLLESAENGSLFLKAVQPEHE
uniref:Ig-like domain-containing protein n=1 Tax=Panagrolaimus sp. JU765 TaxID=591449 RepID=A0AC34PXJ3_9BILA